MSLNPAIFWLILRKSRHVAFSGAYFRCLFDKFKSTGPNVVHISRNDLCVVLDITKQGRVELKTHGAVCLVLITRPRCHVSIGQWEDKLGEKRTNEKIWREGDEDNTPPRPGTNSDFHHHCWPSQTIINGNASWRMFLFCHNGDNFPAGIMAPPRPASPQSGIFSRKDFRGSENYPGTTSITDRTLVLPFIITG